MVCLFLPGNVCVPKSDLHVFISKKRFRGLGFVVFVVFVQVFFVVTWARTPSTFRPDSSSLSHILSVSPRVCTVPRSVSTCWYNLVLCLCSAFLQVLQHTSGPKPTCYLCAVVKPKHATTSSGADTFCAIHRGCRRREEVKTRSEGGRHPAETGHVRGPVSQKKKQDTLTSNQGDNCSKCPLSRLSHLMYYVSCLMSASVASGLCSAASSFECLRMTAHSGSVRISHI